MTNYEKIKAMDFDEFAEFLERNGTCGVCLLYPHCEGYSCKDGVKLWLESEAEDNGTV